MAHRDKERLFGGREHFVESHFPLFFFFFFCLEVNLMKKKIQLGYFSKGTQIGQQGRMLWNRAIFLVSLCSELILHWILKFVVWYGRKRTGFGDIGNYRFLVKEI